MWLKVIFFFIVTFVLQVSSRDCGMFSVLKILKRCLGLPTAQSRHTNEPLECCYSLISSHQRIRIISPNERLPSGHCTLQISQTKWLPFVNSGLWGAGKQGYRLTTFCLSGCVYWLLGIALTELKVRLYSVWTNEDMNFLQAYFVVVPCIELFISKQANTHLNDNQCPGLWQLTFLPYAYCFKVGVVAIVSNNFHPK